MIWELFYQMDNHNVSNETVPPQNRSNFQSKVGVELTVLNKELDTRRTSLHTQGASLCCYPVTTTVTEQNIRHPFSLKGCVPVVLDFEARTVRRDITSSVSNGQFLDAGAITITRQCSNGTRKRRSAESYYSLSVHSTGNNETRGATTRGRKRMSEPEISVSTTNGMHTTVPPIVTRDSAPANVVPLVQDPNVGYKHVLGRSGRRTATASTPAPIPLTRPGMNVRRGNKRTLHVIENTIKSVATFRC